MTSGKRGTKKEPSSPLLELKTCSREREFGLQKWWIFSERVCNFSLGLRAIGPSDFFGPRHKVVLRIKDYTWAPVSGSFDKLHEVGVLSYLSYTLFKWFVDD